MKYLTPVIFDDTVTFNSTTNLSSSLSGTFVPYIGAAADVDLGTNSLKSFDVTVTGNPTPVFNSMSLGVHPALVATITLGSSVNGVWFVKDSFISAQIGVNGNNTFYDNIQLAGTINGSSGDIVLVREAPSILAQRNGSSPQSFRMYNNYIDASNFERAYFTWDNNVLKLGAEATGTGQARHLQIQGSSGNVGIGMSDPQYKLDVNGTTNVRGDLTSGRYTLGYDLGLHPVPGGQSTIQTWWGLKLVGNTQTAPQSYTPSNTGEVNSVGVIVSNTMGNAVAFAVDGAGSQTYELQQWRNSSLTVLASVDKDGNINSPSFTTYNLNNGANYERGVVQWNTNYLQIATEAGGTGQIRDVLIQGASGSTSGAVFPKNGPIVFNVGNYQFRVHDGYLVYTGGSFFMGSGAYGWDLTDASILRKSDNSFTLKSGGVEAWTIEPTKVYSSTSTLVGIGTSTPNEKLTVVGNISATGTNNVLPNQTATLSSSIMTKGLIQSINPFAYATAVTPSATVGYLPLGALRLEGDSAAGWGSDDTPSWFWPFLITKPFQKVSVSHTSGTHPTAVVEIAVYNMGPDGKPTTLVEQGSIPLSTTGIKTFTLTSPKLINGVFYVTFRPSLGVTNWNATGGVGELKFMGYLSGLHSVITNQILGAVDPTTFSLYSGTNMFAYYSGVHPYPADLTGSGSVITFPAAGSNLNTWVPVIHN